MAVRFSPRAATEREFLKALLSVAEKSGGLLKKYFRLTKDGYEITDLEGLLVALKNYAVQLEPWAQKTAEKMLARIEKQNALAWKKAGLAESAILVSESAARLAGVELLRAQMDLIKSLPLQMAERVQTWAVEAQKGGRRASEVATAIENSTAIARNRAMLIARTEIAKTNATLTRARAEACGVTHYIWRTMEDSAVREVHEQMDGLIFEFAVAPYVENEGYHHPGEFPNCRCYAEPIISQKAENGDGE